MECLSSGRRERRPPGGGRAKFENSSERGGDFRVAEGFLQARRKGHCEGAPRAAGRISQVPRSAGAPRTQGRATQFVEGNDGRRLTVKFRMLGVRFLDVDFMRINLACASPTGHPPRACPRRGRPPEGGFSESERALRPRVSVRGSVRSSSRRCCETFGRAGQRRSPKCGNINPPHT